jgi:hypothetical protein
MGVVKMISLGMQTQGLSEEEANCNFWLCDHHGLITNARSDLFLWRTTSDASPAGKTCSFGGLHLMQVQLVRPVPLEDYI